MEIVLINMTIAHPELDGLGNYEYGWSDKSEVGTNALELNRLIELQMEGSVG